MKSKYRPNVARGLIVLCNYFQGFLIFVYVICDIFKGTVEVEDQVEGLNWLSKQYSYIDMDHVAVHGWSYGGFT